MKITRNILDRYAEVMNFKYNFPSSDLIKGFGVVADSYYPHIISDRYNPSGSEFIKLRSSSTTCAISPVVASNLNLPQIHISELCGLLGFQKTYIKKLLLDIKSKKKNLVLIGAGGTGANFIYFLKEMIIWTNTINIFESLKIYDKDKFDLSNLPRIPFTFADNGSRNTNKASLMGIEAKLLSNSIGDYSYNLSINDFTEDNIYYGAPDIATREDIYKYNQLDNINIQFVSATHSGNKCSLKSTPMQDSSIQVESYGKITLGWFFMNHLRMTIEFLELISKDTDFSKTEDLFDYSFKDEYLSGNIGRTQKRYTFSEGGFDDTEVQEEVSEN